jgi:hypothetical protein
MAYAPHQGWVITGGMDKRVHAVDLETNKAISSPIFAKHSAAINHVHASKNHPALVFLEVSA